jgi:hypothetical protein
VDPVSADDLLYDGRYAAEDLMVDRVRITRASVNDGRGRGPMNPTTLKYDQRPEPTLIYEGRAHFQVRADINGNAYESEIAQHEGTIRTANVDLPIDPDPDQGDIGDPSAVRADDRCTLLHSEHDPRREGAIFNIKAETKDKTYNTRRRLSVLEVIA